MPPKKKVIPRDTNFKVGDKVVIRDWDDMEAEYGTNKETGSIICQHTFTRKMEHLCGRTATITSIGVFGVKLDFQPKPEGNIGWTYSTDMIRKVTDTENPAEYKAGDKVRILQWGDMEKKGFGNGPMGIVDVQYNCSFLKSEKHLCGRIAETTGLHAGKVGVYNVRFPDLPEEQPTWFSVNMFEKVEEEPAPAPAPEEGFKVGDTVRIRDWDDLAREFHVDDDGDIDVGPSFFFKSERDFCGQIAKVIGVENEDEEVYVRIEIKAEVPKSALFHVCVLERVEAPEPPKPKKSSHPKRPPIKKPSPFERCEDCEHCEEIKGGYVFCKSWHNLTVKEGFCHKFKKAI